MPSGNGSHARLLGECESRLVVIDMSVAIFGMSTCKV